MPALGMAQDTGFLVAWRKQSGDPVQVGDILMEVETDKSTVEVEAQADGYLSDLRAVAGENVPVGNVIAMISKTKPSGTSVGPPPPASSEMALVIPVTEPNKLPLGLVIPQIATPSLADDISPPNGRILISPKAKRIALQEGLDLELLVEAGAAQPFHLSDIERLRALSTSPKTQVAENTTLSFGPSVSHIAARVPNDEFAAFVRR